jgi:hypothetical protein
MSKLRIVKDEDHNQDARPNTPEQFERDLHPHSTQAGAIASDEMADRQTAYNNKDIVRAYPDLSDDELKRLTILPEGTQLEQGTTYYDLKHQGRGEFRAGSGKTAGNDNWYIAKNQTDYPLWNRIIGVDNPERLDQPDNQSINQP